MQVVTGRERSTLGANLSKPAFARKRKRLIAALVVLA